MIEVLAKLIRGQVFLSGEVVECSISFTHPTSPAHLISQSNDDIFESLAWASAQIICQCFTDPKISKQEDGKGGQALLSNNTALGVGTQQEGKIELATKPKILFCDLRLSPGQTKTCKFLQSKKEFLSVSCRYLPREITKRFTSFISRPAC